MGVRDRDDRPDRPRDKSRLGRHHTARIVVAVGGNDVRVIHDTAGSTAYLIDIPGTRAGWLKALLLPHQQDTDHVRRALRNLLAGPGRPGPPCPAELLVLHPGGPRRSSRLR